ncbi:base non specific RNase Rh [Neoconidiobolus thromboides FSU 785]|nr:base non specific RNase Rh [Neoconidiobolus thromboides FSU 785]
MKFNTGILLSTLAPSVFGQLNSGLTCSNDIRSCSASATDKCCSPDLGLLVLSLQWIPNLGPNNAFTLHGLWPNNCDGSYSPTDGCDASRQYTDLDAIVSADPTLKEQMNTYWSSYNGDNPAFWQHEWGKHGTCYSVFSPDCYSAFERGQDARDYFSTALALRQKTDLYATLSNAGIIPGRSYSRNDFIAAFNQLGAQVQLICKSGAINEVRVYFYVNGKDNFQITNALSTGSCPKTINYPIKG